MTSPLGSHRLAQGLAIAVILGAMGTMPVQAALVLHDSFLSGTDPSAGQYVANKDLYIGGAANPTVAGASGAWASTNTSYERLASVAVGLTYSATLNGQPATLGTGGAVGHITGGTSSVTDSRSISDTLKTTVPGEMWFAGLYTPGGTTSGDQGFLLFTTVGGTDGSVVMGTNAGSLTIGAYNSSNPGNAISHPIALTGSTAASVSTTYLFIVKISITSLASSTSEHISAWINPTDISSEAAMTTTSLAYADNLAIGFALNNYKFASYGFVQQGDGGSAARRFDESMVGYSLSDIQSAFTLAPEPATLALLATGTMMLTWRRRNSVRH